MFSGGERYNHIEDTVIKEQSGIAFYKAKKTGFLMKLTSKYILKFSLYFKCQQLLNKTSC